MFWKHAASLLESTHVKVWFQESCKATLLKSHLSMGVLLQIWCIFSEHLFLGTPLGGCFWYWQVFYRYIFSWKAQFLCLFLSHFCFSNNFSEQHCEVLFGIFAIFYWKDPDFLSEKKRPIIFKSYRYWCVLTLISNYL